MRLSWKNTTAGIARLGAFPERTGLTAGFVGRLIGVKRPDRFLRVVALAAKKNQRFGALSSAMARSGRASKSRPFNWD